MVIVSAEIGSCGHAGRNHQKLHDREGIMMRLRLIFTASILAALVTVIGVAAARTNPAPKERATIEFTQTVKLGDALLKGNYYIVHDEELMAKGEDCTYVYDATGKLVVSFHCIPV